MSSAEAQALLAGAAKDHPEKVGVTLIARSAAGAEVLNMKASIDNTSKKAFFEVTGDPAVFGAQAQAGAAFFRTGLAIYSSPEGSLYLANGTAYVFPPATAAGQPQGFIPSPERSGLGDFFDPADTVAQLGENVTIKSATAITHRGEAAVRIEVETLDKGKPVNGTLIVFQSPPRLARYEGRMPLGNETGTSQTPPVLRDARATADIFYDDDVKVEPSNAAKRALALAYSSNKGIFDPDPSAPAVWTFQVSGGVALADIEVHVKNALDATPSASSMPDLAAAPNLGTMKLTDGSKTIAGVEFRFADADGDGKVSKGDTLTATRGEGAQDVKTFLYDTTTKTYVVPGVGVLALLALAGVAAMAMRRRV